MERKMKTTHKSFQQKVFDECKKIARGRVSTYAKIAAAIGTPRAMRAVGNALNKSPGMPAVPCHRVVRSDGKVGGFASGTKNKIALLKKEGVRVASGKVNLDECAA